MGKPFEGSPPGEAGHASTHFSPQVQLQHPGGRNRCASASLGQPGLPSETLSQTSHTAALHNKSIPKLSLKEAEEGKSAFVKVLRQHWSIKDIRIRDWSGMVAHTYL